MAAARGGWPAAAAISIALHLAAAAAFLQSPEVGPAPSSSIEVWLAPATPTQAAPRPAARKQTVPSRDRGLAAPTPRRPPPAPVSPGEPTAALTTPPAPLPGTPPTTTPAAAPTSSVAGSSRPEDPFDAYARLVWARIDRHRPRSDAASVVAQVAFSLDPEGRLISLRLAASSGTPDFDRAAMRAVRAAAPFPRPPEDIDPARLQFRILIRSPSA
ncbi:MAG: TonB family protein [Caulobacter sp.]|nr:TonB family protein [Caulobacter sp.]